MVGMPARLPNFTCLKSRLTSHSARIWAHGCVWIIIFSHKNANFRIKYQKHDFDYNIKLRGTTGTLTYQCFLKSIDLKVPNLIAPLSGAMFKDMRSKWESQSSYHNVSNSQNLCYLPSSLYGIVNWLHATKIYISITYVVLSVPPIIIWISMTC